MFCLKISLLIFVATVVVGYFICSWNKLKGIQSNILPYKHYETEIVISGKDTIVLLGYKNIGSNYVPQILKTTNGGKSWKESLFDAIPNSPFYFQVDGFVFLYAHDLNQEKAKVYVSSDVGDSWKLVGEHHLPQMSVPIFGEFLQQQQIKLLKYVYINKYELSNNNESTLINITLGF